MRSKLSIAAFIAIVLGVAAAARTAAGENAAAAATVAGVVAGTAHLTIIGGTGVPGGTVGVQIVLSDDVDEAAISADLDIFYPAELIEFFPRVAENCTVDPRIAETHEVGGTIPQPGLLRFALFSSTTLEAVGNGPLATCDFHILPGATTGTSAALIVQFAQLRGADGFIPAEGVPGSITITDVTPEPTPTETPVPPPCVGDCDGNRVVTVAELIRGVNISLGRQELSVCAAFDANGDESVSIAELITAVNRTLQGCGT